MGSLRYWSGRLKVRSLFVSVAAALLVFGSASPAFAVQLNGLEEGEVSGGPATVPDEYVYDHQGDHMQPGDDAKLYKGRHDWCTSSPDQPGVDFRGPCARHDMCYDANPNAVPPTATRSTLPILTPRSIVDVLRMDTSLPLNKTVERAETPSRQSLTKA